MARETSKNEGRLRFLVVSRMIELGSSLAEKAKVVSFILVYRELGPLASSMMGCWNRFSS